VIHGVVRRDRQDPSRFLPQDCVNLSREFAHDAPRASKRSDMLPSHSPGRLQTRQLSEAHESAARCGGLMRPVLEYYLHDPPPSIAYETGPLSVRGPAVL
jgi:hypothetical protein